MSDTKIGIMISNMFQKVDRMEFYVGSSFAILSIVGITSIYIQYLQFSKIKKIEEQLYNIELLKQKDKQYNNILHSKLINQLKNEFSNFAKVHFTNMIDVNQRLIEKASELVYISSNCKKDTLSSSTSMSTFSPIKVFEESNVIEQEVFYESNDFKYDNEDDELLNECYDSIPLNNLKKNTGLSWLFK
jgi:hypothetical protein